jgi:hypothetical protein
MGASHAVEQSNRVLFLFLIYGSEAILPVDLIWNSPRVEQYDEGEAEETRRLEIYSTEEKRLAALFQSACYLQGVQRYYNRNVHPRTFQVGDLVLRRIQDTSRRHKLLSP